MQRNANIEQTSEMNKDFFVISQRVKQIFAVYCKYAEIKDELAKTAISITCYDRNGNVIKQVTSEDDGNVDNGEEPDPTPSNPTPNPDDEEGDGGLAG